jgi:four helix bundle suffix protein
MTDGFIPAHGGYKSLLSYKKAEIVFDATVFFCNRFYKFERRMTDQMVQAARSGKQNIVEGSMASGTSKETEIKLTNVARASLEELLEDYRDFLRIRKLPLWDKNHESSLAIRKLGYGTDTSYQTYSSYLENETAEISANSIVCLIHQTNYLLDQQIRRLEKDFLENGGLRERMTQARLKERWRRNDA